MLSEITLNYQNNDIKIKIIRSNRKSISIEFKPGMDILARIPRRLGDKELSEFIHTKQSIIIKKYQEISKIAHKKIAETYSDIYRQGAKIPLLSEFITIDFEIMVEKKSAMIRLETIDEIKILKVITPVSDIDNIRNCIVSWYRNYAKTLLTNKVKEFSRFMNIEINRIAIREQKTRWGSCSSLGNLNFNWKLIMMPEPIIDYVVVHELAHRKQMNHSKEFWAEVGKVLPDYKERRAWLKKYGEEYNKY